MELAKRCIDVGLFTNQLDDMRTFYEQRVRLPYQELLPVGRGVQQHRYGLLGSVLKVNHLRDPLGPRAGGGYTKISIADPRTPMPLELADPDGNAIELVSKGQRGIDQIEIHLGVTDAAPFERFYGEVLGCERLGPGRFRLGETIISVAHDDAARRADKAAAADVMGAMRATGFRYITIQVRDCDAEHRHFLAKGVWEGAPPVTLGSVARISFIRDPDGNWIEISQRASLVGAIPK